jgi:hypothetical protein
MVDHEWLKHLAGAHWDGSAWRHKDPAAIRELARRRVGAAIESLYDKARDMADAYNQHARGGGALAVLPAAGGAGGFLMLLGRCRMTVAEASGELAATLTLLTGYSRQDKALPRLLPLVDAFGSLAWRRADGSLALTDDLILKWLLEELARAAWEAGDLSRGDADEP